MRRQLELRQHALQLDLRETIFFEGMARLFLYLTIGSPQGNSTDAPVIQMKLGISGGGVGVRGTQTSGVISGSLSYFSLFP